MSVTSTAPLPTSINADRDDKNVSSAQLPAPPKPRTIVCCFDGTGNKFGEVRMLVFEVFLVSCLTPSKQKVRVWYFMSGNT